MALAFATDRRQTGDATSSLPLRVAVALALALVCAFALAQQAHAADPLEPALAETEATAGAVDDATDDVATTQLMTETVEPVAGTTEPVLETVDTVATATGSAVDDTVAPVTDPLIEPLADTVTPLTEPVLETVQPIVDTVAPVTDPLIEPLADTVTPLTEPVLETVQPIVDTAAPLTAAREQDDRSDATAAPYPATTPQFADLVAGAFESPNSTLVGPAADETALLDMTAQQLSLPAQAALLEPVAEGARPATELVISVGVTLDSQMTYGIGSAGTDFIQLGLLASLLLGLFMCRTMITPSFAPTAGLRLYVPVPPG